MAQRRPDPRRPPRAEKWSLADALSGIPAPPTAKVTYGPLTEQEMGGQMTAGLTHGATGEIRLPERGDRFGLAHELFHALDAQVLTDSDRARFQRILRLPEGEWRAGTGTKGFTSPSEIAADYYAAVATDLNPYREGAGRYAEIGPKRLRRFGRSLERLMVRRGLGKLDLGDY